MHRLPGAVLLAASVAACAPSPSPPGQSPPARTPEAAPQSSATPAPQSPSPAASATFAVPATGFAFDAASVLGYYRSIGYACEDPVPDATAAGHTAQVCRLIDPDGRTRTIGLITDPNGDIMRGFASMHGSAGEDFLDPVVALEPLAGFFGAMLGEERGTALVPWLAGHLGDAHAETTSADLHVTTYTQDAAGQTVLFVEVASDDFLQSQKPSSS